MRFLTVDEAAKLLRVSKSTVYGWIHQRRFPYRKHGSRVVIEESVLLALSEASEIPPVRKVPD